jgi:hypothetical protein
VPSGRTVTTAPPRVNAISRPRGDHDGADSASVDVLMRCGADPFALTTATCPASAKRDSYAT